MPGALPRSLTRRLPGLALAAAMLPALVTSCSHRAETPEPEAAPPSTETSAAAPADQDCELLAALPMRDKLAQLLMVGVRDGADAHAVVVRSEEHTSELQSRGHLVCRLLLEKKNHN